METIPTPYYVVYEEKLRRNLELITAVAQRAGVKIIIAFKANALWRTFPIFREYGVCSTASSVNEMLLANDELHCKAHTYCPAYTPQTIEKFITGSSHITFNSIEQFERYYPQIEKYKGLSGEPTRVSTEHSIVLSCGKRGRMVR